MPIQQALQFSDLSALDSSPNAVRDWFKHSFSRNPKEVTPDGISVNSETYFNAVTPAITEQYSHPAYKTLGSIDYTQGETTGDTQAVLGSNYAINKSNQEQTITLTVSGAWQESQTTSSSVTSGMSFTAEVSLEGVFKLGSTFSTSITAGESNTNSTTRTSTASATVKVPPNSKIKVTMVGTMKTQTVNFTAPIQVSGMFGANFPDRVSDHYFWFAGVEQVLPKTTGTLSGTIKNTSAFDVQTEIGEAEPL
ncbi:ETX/MTX2 family pore-forming toxin [Pseudoalteromonas sp. SMS1]|uniref:Uncharacterized protein n=1 Tax=Pseudoalteromonas luteoviolacea TaxID=43657 RepID=A0A1C0TPD1_9GAMM|nr:MULTISPECIES: ETX/MTX2 family pore-forming toxin [Pseudoalteromonas]MBQ4811767.1 ETX/MTX2 family pore-forming toxin [Pseudoalteromonas luteoviolacea]MCF2856646.1 ETX/MTX2 family pore-forming toxin [Pseudoalteromonas sp. SMS1]OCQ20807.1 hypothetical protein A7985_13485 [Pseudoalteromonas luteoviolacea]